MLDIRLTTFRELQKHKDFLALCDEYIEECSDAAIGAPCVQKARYQELELQGVLRCIGVFDGDSLAGLSVLTVNQSQHYSFPLIGIDSIYLRKPWRRGRTGLDLLGSIKAVAKKEGAIGVPIMAPKRSKLEKLCERLGLAQTHSAFWCPV